MSQLERTLELAAELLSSPEYSRQQVDEKIATDLIFKEYNYEPKTLVDRLRGFYENPYDHYFSYVNREIPICIEAAARIVQLEGQVQSLNAGLRAYILGL